MVGLHAKTRVYRKRQVDEEQMWKNRQRWKAERPMSRQPVYVETSTTEDQEREA